MLAAAIMAHANTIATQNTKHLPQSCLEETCLVKQQMDFLIHQYLLCPEIILDKLDDPGAGISRDRKYVIASLKTSAAGLYKGLEAHLL